MNYVIWCATCETIRVPRHGQPASDAPHSSKPSSTPTPAQPPTPRPPLGARILNRITGRNAT